jgi:hypothetical protein
VTADVKAGRLTWKQAAQHASELRNEVMSIIRARSTPVGRSFAEYFKRAGRTLNELVAKKTLELFGDTAEFARLTAAQQDEVYEAIVRSAGKSSPTITARMRTLSRAGRGLLFLSIGYAVYTVVTSDDMVKAAEKELVVTGGGIGGGIAGGALAGLACGPGAPLCVTIGAFVGGALGAVGVEFLWGD